MPTQKNEEVKAQPTNENEEVEVQLEEKTEEAQVQAELPLEPSEEKSEEKSEEELQEYSESVQKRIGKLTAKLREAERREKAALDYATSVKNDLANTQHARTQIDHSYVNEFSNRVEVQQKHLEKELRDAIDKGDIDKQAKVQVEIAKTAQDAQRLAYVKQAHEQANGKGGTPTPTPIPPQPNQVPNQPQAVPIDPKAQDWAGRNEWFGSDEPMTLTAFSHHKKLIENEGYDPQSNDYYEELDRRIRKDFPHKFDETETFSKSTRNGPAVASATRNSGRGNKKSVKLTQSQVAIAKKLGVSLDQYAKQVSLLNK